MLTYTLISCSIAVCMFCECCHLGLAPFEYGEGIFPLCIALSLRVYICVQQYICMCTAVAGKAAGQVVRQASEPGLA